jgi:hypothetical protein
MNEAPYKIGIETRLLDNKLKEYEVELKIFKY